MEASSQQHSPSVDHLKAIMYERLRSSATEEGVLNQVRNLWDIDMMPFPVPLWTPTCPQCGNLRGVIYRLARFFKKGNRDATTPYRCDVGFKCPSCSHAWTHGVVIPRRMFDLHGKRTYTRKTIANYLESMP